MEVREAAQGDIGAIRRIFEVVYGPDYPYRGFFDADWLLRSVLSDHILMLVAEHEGKIVGTASVVFDAGAQSDLTAEFGRLAVDPEARGLGIGGALMRGRVEAARERIHCGLVENRATHPYSQRISHRYGFRPVGLLPMKHLFQRRESFALYTRHFGHGLALRRNHPRVVPEVHPLAHLALEAIGLPVDVIVDEEASSYPHDDAFEVEHLTADGLPSLVRIERGRVTRREIFGPVQLQYGFFKLTARRATYLIARRDGSVAGAIGYIHDELERALKISELIVRDDAVIRCLLRALLAHGTDLGVEYYEVDVGADCPRMQRTLVELGFVPFGYVPAAAFHRVERLDVVKMGKVTVPLDLDDLVLTPESQRIADVVIRQLEARTIRPRIANAMGRVQLFEGLTPEQRVRVAGVCAVEDFAPGDVLFDAGDVASGMYLLLDGTVAIQRGADVIGTVGMGEPVGESALLIGKPHTKAAVAQSPVSAAVLSPEDLKALNRQRPDIGVVLYRNLAIALGRKLERAS